ncbi:MAG: bifunctional aspartate kinase/homoserine dehydrogenase I [Deltaproteobacteria bacterium]|nr:bifunctional aspartate kinase/homoserine dehydrogenase I [Deltaproteobacteria bacterium]
MPRQKNSQAPEVFKFGGASLGDAAAYKHAATIVKACTSPLAVVCSAPAGVTDALLAVAKAAKDGDKTAVDAANVALAQKFHTIVKGALADAAARKKLQAIIDASLQELASLATGLLVLRELTPRTSDLVVSRGERLSARVFEAVLNSAGVKAQYIEPTEIIVTHGPFGGAAPDLDASDKETRKRLLPVLASGVVAVVPGFLGAMVDDAGQPVGTVTLGRGGSDLTATLLGRSLGAQRVSLWKDVPGLLTADPRVVSDARVVPQLNVREAAELAYYGAKVLHPRALIPVTGKDIPVHVRPFGNPESLGTEISARHTLDKYPVKALSAATGQALVSVAGRGLLGVPGVAARTFATLSDHGLSVSLISQSSSEQTICFTVPENEAKAAQKCLQKAFAAEIASRYVDGVAVQAGMATVAVVGLGMAGQPGIAARVFGAMAGAGINIVAIAQGSSELNISFVVSQAQAGDAQRAIHDTFQLSKIGGGSVRETDHVDVVLLGFGQIGRTLAALIAKSAKNGKSGRKKPAGRGADVSRLRVVGAVDRSGFVFSADGLTSTQVAELAKLKAEGRSFANAPKGHKGSPLDAVHYFAKHALSRPVLVDVTAHDTTAVLMAGVQAGMDIVLANKRPMSSKTSEHNALRAAVKSGGRQLRFEATVGAGLPILDTYRKLAESGDKVLRIEGCVSGTLGYLLTAVGQGKSFSEAVKEAMAKGYTEPDPRDDLSGADVGRKALILGRLLGFAGEPDDVVVESLVPAEARKLSKEAFVEKLPSWDAEWTKRVEAARAQGAVLRYVATVTAKKISVGLRKVPRGTPFASLEGTDNQIAFTTTRYRSPLVITGAGAGLEVTAGGVLNDLLDLTGA